VEATQPSEHLLRYGDEEIAYSVRLTPRRKGRVAINVRPDGEVDVEAPETATAAAIASAVQKRARWIVAHVREARKRFEHVWPRHYVSGEQVFYQGRRYGLKVRKVAKSERSVKLKGGLLVVATDNTERGAVRARLRAWYRVRARDYFAERIAAVAKTLPWRQQPPPFRLLDMSKHWGSCATRGTVTLNPFLVKAPREGIDYVIAHELCHLREHNHSPAFFRLLNRVVPGWEGTKARLDAMAEVILND
jgi:predicted metal-dependent hydrolase